MKTKPFPTYNGSSTHDARIEAALRVYSHAEPAPGLEGRVVAWISARQTLPSARAARVVVMWRFFAAALAVAAACAIVAGSVQHSRHAALPQAAKVQHQGGVTAAGAAHVPSRPTPVTPTIDPAAPRTPAHGRAIVSRDQGRHDGAAAVPPSPYLPDQQPAQPPQ